uniref:Uncharacterized protein n=1 Tax=Candidatus Kentrum sp. LFY TaxID=2126342 RepID=A0A450UV07_9GAMM|nr:MAG: hypothetical protein BECKLFY1418A_GA0070994_10326 [Candidatus Kentron sp. LFY]VFJ96384.1 MAG: hypothetical protein BECKLFY1418B_GA0070995_108412 [Candidatus Kentron sp. LFY]
MSAECLSQKKRNPEEFRFVSMNMLAFRAKNHPASVLARSANLFIPPRSASQSDQMLQGANFSLPRLDYVGLRRSFTNVFTTVHQS